MPGLKLFYCYADQDYSLYERLDTQLIPLKRALALTTFSQAEVMAGQELKKELLAQLTTADIILLLISPDFLASDYCYSPEMQLALSRHDRKEACVIPILLRPADWHSTPFSKFKVLPDNRKPVTAWKNQDKAFYQVAVGIRQRIEADLSSIPRARIPDERTLANALKPQQTVPPLQAQLEHFLYLSDKKMLNLKQQLSGWPGEAPTSFQDRFTALISILTELQKKRQIWNMADVHTFKSGEYIAGQCAMRWGVMNWGMKVCFFFSASLPQPRVILMAGSASHLWNNRQAQEYTLSQEDFGVSGSDLPGIMSAIEFAATHSNIRWFDGVGDISDYLFLLGFIQRKFIHHMQVKHISTAFPIQSVKFTALVLKTLQRPATRDWQEFFASSHFKPREKKEIVQMLQQAPEILLCTPLYVALSTDT
ncbi:MAG TPA: toll/interleukin-1 receptor domain-containing protein [Ktedonobacteraceae bacterium]|nr:toll/interleukin-1 receptor domain-containing protein [Ktedonobacteraceae bacterium]